EERNNFSKLEISNGYSDVNFSNIPEINYTSLNNLWNNPAIEMLIITPNRSDFIEAVKPLAEWKNEKGVKTIILSNFSLYEGVDNAEKIRNMIKFYYQNENIRWVLLAGDAQSDLLPIRYVFNPDVQIWGQGQTETVGDEELKPTDFYYADLTGTWDNDEDGNWGEAPQDNSYGLDEISWTPEVYVGRFPADNAYELEIMVNKTIKYESNPYVGDWMNRMLLAGGVSSYNPQEYESRLTNFIIENYAKNETNTTHLIQEENNLTQALLDAYFNDGYSTVLMTGHGGEPTSYYRDPSQIGYTSSDASSSTNTNSPSLVYLDACTLSSYDVTQDNSIGETLIKRLDAGAIGAIGGLRLTWYIEGDTELEKLNRGNAKLFWREFYVNNKYQQGRALYDSKKAYINSDYYTIGLGSTDYDFERKNLLTYCLLGDPEVDIYTNKPKVVLNPFNSTIYEGQLVSITIRDENAKLIPYARIHLKNINGKYHTVYADKNGLANFRIPNHENEVYNVTITGHNLIPSNFNFTALPDYNSPDLNAVEITPGSPSASNNIVFNIEASDNQSGVESVYVYLSKDNFTSYSYFGLSNNFGEDYEQFSVEIGKLESGDYSYFIYIRDYANNTRIFYDLNYKFSVLAPLIDYILIISIFAIIGVVGIAFFLLFIGFRKYTRTRY
ncbi:MAG: C25 family cysteine peptidase, partial [Candidatus Thorarchaeota archaeon]